MKLNRTGSNWTELERNKINENWDIIEGLGGTLSKLVTGLVWKEPVDTVGDLPANAEVGETRMVREADPDGISYVYRYDGENWEKIQVIDVSLINEVDRRLRTLIEEEAGQRKSGDNILDSIKADKSYVDDKVRQVANGAPKGVFSTLTDLKAAYPNGDSNNYLVMTDGHIYSWDGTEWIDTGIQYQSAGIAKHSIEYDHLTTEVSKKITSDFTNLFEKSSIPTSITPSSEFARLHISSTEASKGEWRQYSGYHPNYQVINIIKGHKYYIRYETMPNSPGKLSKSVRIIYEDGTTQGAGTWGNIAYDDLVSHIITADKTSKANVIVEVGIVDEIIRKNQLIIDLTAVYGAGNEPNLRDFEKVLDEKFGGWIDYATGVSVVQTEIFRDLVSIKRRLDSIDNDSSFIASDFFVVVSRNGSEREVIHYDYLRKVAYAVDTTGGIHDKTTLYASYNLGKTWESVYQSDQGIAQMYTLKSGYHLLLTHDIKMRRVAPDFSGHQICNFPETLVRRPMNTSIGIDDNGKGTIMFSQYGVTQGEIYNIYKSTDDGLSWEVTLEGTDVRHWHSVQVDPYTGHWWACGGDNNQESRFMRSINNGGDWELIGTGSQVWRACGLVFTQNEILWAMDTAGIKPYVYKMDKLDLEPIIVGEVPYGATTLGVARTVDGLMFGWTRVEANSPNREKAVLFMTDGEEIKVVQEFLVKPEIVSGTDVAGFTYCSLIDDENRWFGLANRTVLDGSLGIKLPLGVL